MNLRQQSRLRAQRRSALAMKARQRRMRAEVSAAALDRAKAKTGSDYKTAQIIHTTPQRVSDYRKARRPMGPEQAARLAYFLGDPILQAVALALAFSCKKRQTREFWLSFSCGTWPGANLNYLRWKKSKPLLKYPIWGG